MEGYICKEGLGVGVWYIGLSGTLWTVIYMLGGTVSVLEVPVG